jgi:hypothetical protein
MNKHPYTNPAERALTFVKNFSSSASTEAGNRRQVRGALAAMYDLQANDTSSLMTALSDAWKLPVQIRKSIEKNDLESEAFEHVISDLEYILSLMNLNADAVSIKNNIPASLIPSLGMISSVLNKDLPEVLITKESIDQILENIKDVEDEIRKAELDREFTDFILHKSDSIKYALNHYETLGPDEVISRVDQMFGGVLRNYQKLTSNKKKAAYTSKLLGIGAAVIYAIGAVNGAVEISENLSKFIEADIQINAEIINDPTPIPSNTEKTIA